MIDCELHSHTHYSRDSLNRLRDIIDACHKAGIDRIAITDHSEIAGALKAFQLAPELVIVSEEVKTTQGDLLCYFIQQKIPRGVTPEEAIQRVHDQGGIVGPAHPLDTTRAGLGRDNVLRLREQIDFIEVFNARTIDPAHTMLDGDTVFALATGATGVRADLTTVGAVAATALAEAVVAALRAATGVAGIPSLRELAVGKGTP